MKNHKEATQEFTVLDSFTSRVVSDATRDEFLATIKEKLGRASYKYLIQGQHEGLIISVKIGLEEKPKDGTYISTKGLEKLTKKMGDFLDKKPEGYEEIKAWFEAREILNELRAAKGGWV